MNEGVGGVLAGAIGLMGRGAIAGSILALLRAEPTLDVAGVLATSAAPDAKPEVVTRVDQLPKKVSLVIEAAGVDAVRAHAAAVLESERDLAVLSVAAFADEELMTRLLMLAHSHGRRLYALCGAIGGIDALSAAAVAGLHSVHYTGRKPPSAWRKSAAEAMVDLSAIRKPTVFFEGTAREAAMRFPKNANVTAMIGLAGIGLDRTTVTLTADPSALMNVHAYEAEGDAIRIRYQSESRATTQNPSTSVITACGVVSFLRSGTGALLL